MGAKSSRLSIVLFLYKKVNLTPNSVESFDVAEFGADRKENAAEKGNVP